MLSNAAVPAPSECPVSTRPYPRQSCQSSPTCDTTTQQSSFFSLFFSFFSLEKKIAERINFKGKTDNSTICQDRLGTDARKTDKKGSFSHLPERDRSAALYRRPAAAVINRAPLGRPRSPEKPQQRASFNVRTKDVTICQDRLRTRRCCAKTGSGQDASPDLGEQSCRLRTAAARKIPSCAKWTPSPSAGGTIYSPE